MGQLWIVFTNIIRNFIKDKKLCKVWIGDKVSVPLKSLVKMYNDSYVELGKLESFILFFH